MTIRLGGPPAAVWAEGFGECARTGMIALRGRTRRLIQSLENSYMSRSTHIVLAVLLLAFITVPVWAQGGMLRGTVVDQDKNPIDNATITITSENLPSYRDVLSTNKRGKFTARFQANQVQYQFELLFEAPGFQSFKQPFSPSSTRQMREEFVMEKGEAKVVESMGDLGSVVSGSSNEAITAFNEGVKAQRDGDLKTARTKLEAAIAADPTLGPAHVALSQVLLDTKQYEAALAAANSALERDISRTDALRVKYQALRALGKKDEAEVVSAELSSAEDAAASARRFYNEGGEAFKAGDHDAALASFLKAAEADPSLKDAHHAIATLQLAKGQHAAAAESAERALALGSDDVNTLRVLYDALDAQGEYDKLMEIAPRLASVDPEFGGAKLVEQAAEMWNAGQTDRAIVLSRQALAIDPSLAKAYYFIGLDSLSKGKNDEAKAALSKFIEMAPEDAEAATAKEMLTYIQ